MTFRNIPIQIGLIALLSSSALAGPGEEQGRWSGGLRAGALLSVSEFDDSIGPLFSAYLRRGIREGWQGEISAGYGRYRGADYGTDVVLGEARLLFSPFDYEEWNPYFFGGLGLVRYDLDEIFIRTDDVPPTGWGMTAPVGVGLQYRLSDSVLLELSGGYTYTMLDDLNGAILKEGNDVYWSALVGLTFGRFGAAPARRPSERPASRIPPAAPADRDGDGLTDQEEKEVYFTNPLMADSDGDGLIDAEEVKTYRTDPNRPDTDGGGVTDGEEVRRGSDPLSAADDAGFESPGEAAPAPGEVQAPAEAVPAPETTLPSTVNFPYGSTSLTPEARKVLDLVAQRLRSHPDILLELRGYTDSVGEREANLRLSRRRAKAVKAYLVEQGVAPWRLTIRALGESDPVASNQTPEGRRKNRRVELVPVP